MSSDRRLETVRDQGHGFASDGSPRPASQHAQAETKGGAIQNPAAAAAGRSLPTHPIVLRDVCPRPDAPPKQRQLNQLHRSLNQRDLVILQSLYDYRYLDTFQIKELFFPSLRSCQMRLQSLQDLGVIHRWKVIETPGVRRCHSLVLISTLGARVLADCHKAEPGIYVERARNARDHCWHAPHDLEANQFFVSLAVASLGRPDEGLLTWLGEGCSRSDYRRRAREYRWPAPAPDGGGIYVARGRQIEFDLGVRTPAGCGCGRR